MRAHVIENGKVVNTVVVDELGEGMVDASIGGSIGDAYDEKNVAFTTPLVFSRAAATKAIDAAVEAIYDRPVRLSKEYEKREAAALAFRDAGYKGEVPARVAGFATPAGLEPAEATDLILAQAAAFHDALDELSDLRMRKYEVARALTDLEAMLVAEEVLSAIATIGRALA